MKQTGKKYQEPRIRVAEFRAEDMVYVATVRSPVSKGVLKSIHIPHLPRDYRSITADDIPGSRSLEAFGHKVPILASGRLSYKGEAVALIVGPNPERLSEAVRLTKVNAEEEKGEFDFERFSSARVLARHTVQYGDVELALSVAHTIVEGEFRTGPLDHCYPEALGAAAIFDYDKLIVYTSTQWPFHVRAQVASVLKTRAEDILVKPTALGMHLDGKLWYPALLSCQAALAAFICRKPALLMLSREEDFRHTPKRAPMLVSYRAGLDSGGKLLAVDSRIMINGGSYGVLSDELAQRSAAAALGSYACPNIHAQSFAVETNLPPLGSFSSIGINQTLFGIECLMDQCAQTLDMDPLEFREMNLLGKGSETASGIRKKNIPFKRITERLCALSDFRRKRSSSELVRKRRNDPGSPPGRGIGFAFASQSGTGFHPGGSGVNISIEVTLDKESRVLIRSSSVPETPGTLEIWKKAAGDIIGAQIDRIAIKEIDTDSVPDSGPSSTSGTASLITRLIESACETIRTKRFREALPIIVRKTYRHNAKNKMFPGEDDSWAGAVVELELDEYTGQPKVLGAWMVVDAGKILSTERAHATVSNGIVNALSQIRFEALSLENGMPDASAFRRYRVARLRDAPPITVEFVGNEPKEQSGGIGDLAYAVIPAAFANALGQAMDMTWQTDSVRTPRIGIKP